MMTVLAFAAIQAPTVAAEPVQAFVLADLTPHQQQPRAGRPNIRKARPARRRLNRTCTPVLELTPGAPAPSTKHQPHAGGGAASRTIP